MAKINDFKMQQDKLCRKSSNASSFWDLPDGNFAARELMCQINFFAVSQKGNCFSLELKYKSKVWNNLEQFCIFVSLRKYIHTMLLNWESTKSCLCNKFPLFRMSWWMLRVLLQLSPLESSLPYLKAFQWGTVWPFT